MSNPAHRIEQQALQQLSRNYRANKKAQFKAAFEAQPKLKVFDREIRRCGIEDAGLMIQLCQTNHDEWLRNADLETRALALEIVSRQIIHIRSHNGLPSFDDPLPWQPADVYQTCRKILTT